ncbi:MAG: ATP-binding protein [Methanoculleaceae archaeon]
MSEYSGLRRRSGVDDLDQVLFRVLVELGVPAEEAHACCMHGNGEVAAHLERWAPHEVVDLIEILIYISICQQISGGVTKEECDRHMEGSVPALLHAGLVTRTGKGLFRTTSAGELIAATVRRTRIAELEIDHLARRIPLAIPVLLSCRTDSGGVMKRIPPGPDEGLGELTRHSTLLMTAFLRFARLLREHGLAVETGVGFVCVPELPYILREMIRLTDEDLVERATAFYEEAERIRKAWAVLCDGERTGDPAVLDIVRSWYGEMESVVWTGPPTARGEIPCIISDAEAYLREGEAIYEEALARLAGDASALLSEYWVPASTAEKEEVEDRTHKPAVTGPDGRVEEPAGPPPRRRRRSTPGTRAQSGRPGPVAATPSPATTGAEPDADSCRIFLGHDREGRRVWWCPAELNNGHMIIIGGSGAGKTETIRCIAGEICEYGIPVVLIDFHGDMVPAGRKTESYRIREGSPHYFNPFELDPSIEVISPLRATSDFVDAISINFPTLGIQQRRRLKSIIKDCYRRAGITADPATWDRELDCSVVEAEIMACEDESLPAYLEDIFDYRLFSGEKKITISHILEGGITHLDLNALPENLRYLFADLFLRRLYYSLQAMGEIPRTSRSAREKFRLFVIVDEAKLLVCQKTGSKQTVRAVLNKYATEMRKFGVGLILASQIIGHFNPEILANIAVKFCMRTENRKQARENAKFFELQEEELMKFPPGCGVLVMGGEKRTIQIVPSHLR